MHSQLELLNLAREKLGGVTYYRVGKLLGFTSAYTSALSHSRSLLSAEAAVRLAALCQLPAEYVVSCIEHERARREHADKPELAGTWQRIAEHFGRPAASLLVVAILAGCGALFSGRDARASLAFFWPAAMVRTSNYRRSNLYIMRH